MHTNYKIYVCYTKSLMIVNNFFFNWKDLKEDNTNIHNIYAFKGDENLIIKLLVYNEKKAGQFFLKLITYLIMLHVIVHETSANNRQLTRL